MHKCFVVISTQPEGLQIRTTACVEDSCVGGWISALPIYKSTEFLLSRSRDSEAWSTYTVKACRDMFGDKGKRDRESTSASVFNTGKLLRQSPFTCRLLSPPIWSTARQILFAASRTALLVNPVGPPNALLCSIIATLSAPSCMAWTAAASPPGPDPCEFGWYRLLICERRIEIKFYLCKLNHIFQRLEGSGTLVAINQAENILELFSSSPNIDIYTHIFPHSMMTFSKNNQSTKIGKLKNRARATSLAKSTDDSFIQCHKYIRRNLHSE